MRRSMSALMLTALPALALIALSGCDDKKQPPTTPAPKAGDHSHSDGHDHGHDHDHGEPHAHAPGHGGAVIALGEATIGSFNAKATRDEGQILAGKDAPIDVTVTPAAGATTKATAVRFWIGTQDAKGSVKAKANVEDPKDPNRWHTHAEIPNPLPPGSKLWIEIEDEKGGKSVGSFDLKS